MKPAWSRRFWAVFFPERCIYCGKVIPPCLPGCEECLLRLPRILPPVCRLCGLEKKACTCEGRRMHYERCIAPFYYDGKAKYAILQLKTDENGEVARVLAAEMAAVVRREYGKYAFDYVVPVPMTAKEKKKRKHNPCDRLAKALSAELGIPVGLFLNKIYETRPQKELSSLERSGNVLGAFDVAEGALVAGKTLLLVDDTVTTGATLDECAKMLKIFGADEVYAVAGTASRLSKTTG